MAAKKEQDDVMNDVQKQVADMLAQAKAEAQRIVEEAQIAADAAKAAVEEARNSKSEEEAKKAEEAEAAKKLADYMEEYVEVYLFKDNNKYKDDVFVAVNGENCVIKRGERVKVKRKFAEVLDHSAHQDYETSKLIESATKTKKLGDL